MKKFRLAILLILVLLTACIGTQESPSSQATQTADAEMAATALAETLAPTMTPTVTATFTVTPTATEIPPTPTITPTPWALATPSASGLLPGVSPMSYVDDPCAYLADKWSEGKAEPGTIVVPIMFHSILKPGKQPTKAEDITTEYFEFFMEYAKQLGFETVTTAELVDFLENNTAIPKYSMILILDDKRPDTPLLFMPYLEANDWTLTLAVNMGETSVTSYWDKTASYVEGGRVEVQAHGFNHMYIQNFTSQDVIDEEIYQPITEIQSRFGTTPQAFIWPGGNFTTVGVETVREAGYQIAFTVYSRGPLMYNRIPLGDPEKAMEDPLMVLPRAWSSAADVALNQALLISQSVEAQADELRAQEELYYSLFCTDGTGD